MSEFSECGESFIPTRFIEWNLTTLFFYSSFHTYGISLRLISEDRKQEKSEIFTPNSDAQLNMSQIMKYAT